MIPHLPRALSSLSQKASRFGTRTFGTHVCLPIGNFPYKWLRDSCPSPGSIHPDTRQKLHRTTDAIKDAKPKSVNADKDGLRIEWESGHESFYPIEYLARYSSYGRLTAFHNDVRQHPWNLVKMSANDRLFLPYESFQTDAGRLAAMTQLERVGLVFVQGVPNTETSNEACELRRVAETFGEIRNTFYGPLWDVKNVKNSRNIAYTNLDLGLHMDLLSVYSHLDRFACLVLNRNQVLPASPSISAPPLSTEPSSRRFLDIRGRSQRRKYTTHSLPFSLRHAHHNPRLIPLYQRRPPHPLRSPHHPTWAIPRREWHPSD